MRIEGMIVSFHGVIGKHDGTFDTVDCTLDRNIR